MEFEDELVGVVCFVYGFCFVGVEFFMFFYWDFWGVVDLVGWYIFN